MPKWAVGRKSDSPNRLNWAIRITEMAMTARPGTFHAADDGEYRADTVPNAVQITVIQMNGVVHNDAEDHARDQHSRHIQRDAGRTHHHKDEKSVPDSYQADQRATERAEQQCQQQQYLHECRDETPYLAVDDSVFLV